MKYRMYRTHKKPGIGGIPHKETHFYYNLLKESFYRGCSHPNVLILEDKFTDDEILKIKEVFYRSEITLVIEEK